MPGVLRLITTIGTSKNTMSTRNYTRYPVKARVISHNHGLAYSVKREFSELLTRLGIGDRAIAYVADMDRPVGFKAVMRLFGGRFYIHIPRWAMQYYKRGEEVRLLITPLKAPELPGPNQPQEPVLQ